MRSAHPPIQPCIAAELRCVLARVPRAVEVLGLNDREVDRLLDHPSRSWRSFSTVALPPRIVEERLRLLIEVADIASSLIGDGHLTAAWFRAPNPGLPNHAVPLVELLARPWELRGLRDALARERVDASR